VGNVTTVPAPVQSKQIGLSKKQILGYAGAAILIVGVFMPVVSIPIYGSITYYNNGTGDGLIIIILAAISAAITFYKKYPGLLLTAGASLLIIAYDFLNLQSKISDLTNQLQGNIFGNAIAQAVQMQWGWAVLVIGALLLVAAVLIKED